MKRSFITFYRENKQLHTSKLNGFPFVCFGMPVGEIEGVTCFDSVTITIGGKREKVVTAEDLGGPVAICVETQGQPSRWFALAGREDHAAEVAIPKAGQPNPQFEVNSAA